MKLSVLILAKNEQSIIENCLRRLNFASEIIVLDQNSADNTVKIAQKYTKNILTSDSSDFSKNRKLLSDSASGDWLLYLDCDEIVTKKLIAEIRNIIATNGSSAYYIPRKNYVLGRLVAHGGWWPDYAPRLFKKRDLIGWTGKVHESPQIRGRWGYLKNALVHQSARNLNLMLNKSINWAKIEADLYSKSQNPKINTFKIIKATSLEFIKRYFMKKGFQDGSIGLIEAIYQGLHQAIIFTYLWEIQNKSKEEFEKIKREIQK